MYGFIVGGAGNFAMVMEGRGFSYLGSHNIKYNRWSISVGLIGEFNSMEPGWISVKLFEALFQCLFSCNQGTAMMNALKQFLQDAVVLGKLTDDYQLHDGFLGVNALKIIRTWPHYVELKVSI